MTRYDRYFMGVFFQSLLLVLALITTVYLVIDVLLNLDEFQRFDNLARDVTLYYAFNLPPILYLLFPLIVVASGLFALARMIRSREIIVLQVAGIGPRRALTSIFLGALLLGVSGLALREFALPQLNLMQRESPSGASEFRKGKRLTVRDDAGNSWFVRRYDLNVGRLSGVRILSRDGRTLVVAEEMTWVPARHEWNAPSGQIHDLGALLEHLEATPVATPFAGKPPVGEMLPADFARRKRGFTGTPLSELWQQSRERDDYRELGVALSHELWHPFGGLLMLLVGAGIVLAWPARMFLASSLALGAVLAYQIGVFWFETLATAGVMSPAMGAASTPVICATIGIVLWARK